MKKHFISFILLLTMVFQIINFFPMTVNAIDMDTPNTEHSIPSELISEDDISANGHEVRVFEAESNMNEICILNKDGSNSVYIFDYAVKYIDENDGKIKDKSNKLHQTKRNNYLYVNQENNIRTTFPKKITKHPVITTVDDYKISIGIITDSKTSKKGQLIGENYILYNEAFGENTAIGYSTQFNGYKEEIILYSENTPKTFSFQITCEGLLLNNQNGYLSFIDETSNETIFTFDPFYIYDSSEQEKGYIDTTYTVVQTSEYNYLMTIVLDNDFLQTEGLTYPVYIDPSVKYNERSYIDDASIYSARADETCGNHLVGYIGKYTDAYGTGRLLVRFPEMIESNSLFNSLIPLELISVKLYLYNYACGSSTTTLYAHQFSGEKNWTESNATWNNVNADAIGSLQDSVTISSTSNGYYAFDITSTAETWLYNSYSARRGIIITNSNESNIDNVRCIRTSDFSDSYKPYIIVNYTKIIADGIYCIQNAETQRYMDVEGPSVNEEAIIQQWDFHDGNQAKWNITKQSDGYYTIQSVYSGKYIGVENGYLYDGVPIKQYSSNTDAKTRWGFSISSNGNYIITAKSAGTENRVLSVPLNSDGNGVDLIQRTYSNDADYRDEWQLYRIKYTATINNFYDNGYLVRYNESAAESKNNIKSYTLAVAERYLQLFGLSLTINEASYFSSALDECKGTVTSDNIDTTCSHALGIIHHSNRSNVITNFKLAHNGDNKTISVFWTGHKIESTDLNGNTYINRSCSSGHSVFMLELCDDNNRTMYSQGILMHELNHQFEVGDHYHEETITGECKFKDVCSECGSNKRPSSCIMFQSRIDINTDTVICDECQNDIVNHLEDHH